MDDRMDLAAYRRSVAESYAAVRVAEDRHGGWKAWQAWRERRDLLIGTHAQSPLPAGRRTPEWQTPFFGHDPAWRLEGDVRQVSEPETFEIPHSGDGVTRFVEVARVRAESPGGHIELTVYWLDAYGGGMFLPFRDTTNGGETYGGGRYLLDTVKGADLGATDDGRLVLDFNYAYHPSCAWDSHWSCPLAPPSNHLTIEVSAGERLPLG